MLWNKLVITVLLFGCSFVLQAHAEQEIRILDLEGKTQSVVEIDDSVPDQMVATVRVSLTLPDQTMDQVSLENIQGVEISLVKVVGGREGDVLQTAKTFKNGVATFNGVPPGIYKTRIECEQIFLLNAVISGPAVVDRSTGQAPAPETLDQLHLMDKQGATRAMAEIPLGQSADVSVTVGDSSKDNQPTKDVRVLLIEVEPDTEEEMEVYAAQMSNNDGISQFNTVPGGVYKVRMECNKYGLGGVKFTGGSVMSCTCPINPIAGPLAELMAPVSYLSLETAIPAVALPVAAGLITTPKDSGGDTPPSQSVIDSEQK